MVCSYGKFQPGRPGWIQETQPKWWNITELILFATVRTLWTLVTLLIKLFRILLKWKYIQDQNYTVLAAIWWERSYFVENVSSRSPGWSVHMGKFSSRPLIDIFEHIDIFTKKRLARRDLGNRASPVDRAHMKRPLENYSCIIWFLFGSQNALKLSLNAFYLVVLLCSLSLIFC